MSAMEKAVRLICALALLQLVLWPTPGAHAVTSPVCETSGGSPTTTDCARVITSLENLGSQDCCNTNLLGSKCTDMATYGTCKASICINSGCQPCNVVAPYVRGLTNTCSKAIDGVSRTGGYQYMNENSGLRIQISHT